MGKIDGIARALAFAAFSACALVVTNGAIAQQEKKSPPPDAASEKQAAKSAAQAALDAGLKSYNSGKFQPAVDQLSASIKGGGLASAEMARALYTRGLAYKKQSKPGLAISDLTSALWLKNGLSAADKQVATAERADAYRMAGLGEGPSVPDAVVSADPNKGPDAPKVQSKPQTQTADSAPVPSSSATATSEWSSVETTVTRQSPDSEKAQEAARARKIATTPVDPTGIESAVVANFVNSQPSPPAPSGAQAPPAPTPWSEPVVATNDAQVLSAVPAGTPEPATPAPSSVPSSISGFFSNIFGGANSPQPQPATITAAAEPQSPPASAPAPLTTASTSPVPPPTIAAAPAPLATVKGGKYKLHIAAMRSRPEAEALAQQLAQKHGGDLKSRAPAVDEAVIGSMGTFYRVRVGSYPNAEEPRGVCNKLRTSGFDCLVVTN